MCILHFLNENGYISCLENFSQLQKFFFSVWDSYQSLNLGYLFWKEIKKAKVLKKAK